MGLGPATPPTTPPPTPAAPDQAPYPPYAFDRSQPFAGPTAPPAARPPAQEFTPQSRPATPADEQPHPFESASAGRRFSLDNLIEQTADDALRTLEPEAAPTLAPSIEPEPGQPFAPQPVAPEAPDAAVQPDADAAPTRQTRCRFPFSSASSQRRWLPAVVIIAAVVVVALIVGVAVWLLNPGPATTPPAGFTPAQAPDALLSPTDLQNLGLGADWEETSTSPTPADIVCVGPAATENGSPRLMTRQLMSQSNETNLVNQFVATFADDATASAAYQAAVTASGTCPDGSAQVAGAFTINGLADQATIVAAVTADQDTTNHTILMARTGRTLSVVDVSTPDDAVLPATLADAAVPVLSRLCAAGQGTCPSSVSVAQAIPAAGNPPGWLVPADMPLLSPSAGLWGASDRPQLTNVSSQCDGVNLKSLPDMKSAHQRTLILTGGSAQLSDFGVDQLVYTFSNAKDATADYKTLTKNIKSCAKTVLTATVKTGKAVQGTGEDDVKITASTYKITHKISGDKQTTYRVAVLTVGDRLGYLLANVNPDLDFTDTQWQALTLRAGERISQS